MAQLQKKGEVQDRVFLCWNWLGEMIEVRILQEDLLQNGRISLMVYL